MSTVQKHHYRNVYKSDHLGVADLEELKEQGHDLVFVIREVKQEINKSVAGKKGNFNIAYFTDSNIKPWVLNAGNAKVVKTFSATDAFVESWKNIPVRLYIDSNVKMKGEIVGGVKIDPIQPKVGEKQKPPFLESNFEKAKLAGATIEQIKERYSITSEIEKQYLEYVGTEK